jgi:hypothetical protein
MPAERGTAAVRKPDTSTSVTAHVPGRDRVGDLRRRLVISVAATMILSACSTLPSPKPATAGPTIAAAAIVLTIDHPAQGAVVTASPVDVGGRAPAGQRVVLDISFAPDKQVIASADGRWTMLVDLKQGSNTLVFRLGDDATTEIDLGLTLSSSGIPSAASSEAPQITAAPPTAVPATPKPTAVPPTPKPTTPPPVFRTFGDGTWEVGSDIKAGTYRLREPAFGCYWARLKGFDGTLNDILANENVDDAYAVVTIKSTDAGFESSDCDEWSSDLSRVTDSKSAIDYDGTYIVGTDITAGKWKSTGGDFCYWARLSGFTGTLGAILANGLPTGPTIVTIRSTDKGFLTTGCGTWFRQ